MESLNDNHPPVCRSRHALTAVRTGSISCVCIFFSAATWNLAILIIPLCDVLVMP